VVGEASDDATEACSAPGVLFLDMTSDEGVPLGVRTSGFFDSDSRLDPALLDFGASCNLKSFSLFDAATDEGVCVLDRFSLGNAGEVGWLRSFRLVLGSVSSEGCRPFCWYAICGLVGFSGWRSLSPDTDLEESGRVFSFNKASR